MSEASALNPTVWRDQALAQSDGWMTSTSWPLRQIRS